MNSLEDYYKSAWTTVVVHRLVQCENVVTIETWSNETIPKNHLISTFIIINVMICFDFYLLLSHASFFPSLHLLDHSSPSWEELFASAKSMSAPLLLCILSVSLSIFVTFAFSVLTCHRRWLTLSSSLFHQFAHTAERASINTSERRTKPYAL